MRSRGIDPDAGSLELSADPVALHRAHAEEGGSATGVLITDGGRGPSGDGDRLACPEPR
jgi:hypothetical protein